MDDGSQSTYGPADLSALFQSRLREMTAGDGRGARVPEAMNGPSGGGPVGVGIVDDVIDLEAVWTRAIASLGDDVLPAQHRAWMRLTKPLALVQDTAVLATPNDFAREVLDTKLRDVIVEALSRQLGRDVRVAVTVEPEGGSPQPTTTPFIVTNL